MQDELTEQRPVEIDVQDPVDGEIVADEEKTIAAPRDRRITAAADETRRLRTYLRYLVLPALFLTAALLGGLRFGGTDNAFIFLKPALLNLVFAAILLVLFVRGGLIRIDGWFSEKFPLTKNIANGAVMASLFAASTQMFNSLIPEAGLPFWIVGFCFFWTLWNNLFAEFDTKRLIRSLGAMFGLAFVVKYLLLANLTAPRSDNWLRAIIEDPGREAFTWLLDLPRFSPATGYVQFFAVGLFLLGLYLLPATTSEEPEAGPYTSSITAP